MKITYTSLIPVIHANLFIMAWAIQNCFQGISEGKLLILKENPTKTQFYEKMNNTSGDNFLLTTKLYKTQINSVIMGSKIWNPEGKA